MDTKAGKEKLKRKTVKVLILEQRSLLAFSPVFFYWDEWLKEIAPSTELRKWFGHKPENFPVFKEKYIAELQTEPAKSALAQLTTIVQRKEKVTLLYGAKDEVHNQAVVLAEYLNRKT